MLMLSLLAHGSVAGGRLYSWNQAQSVYETVGMTTPRASNSQGLSMSFCSGWIPLGSLRAIVEPPRAGQRTRRRRDLDTTQPGRAHDDEEEDSPRDRGEAADTHQAQTERLRRAPRRLLGTVDLAPHAVRAREREARG